VSLLRTEVTDAVARITLDDPDRRNALSLELVEELDRVLTWLESDDDARAVVVTGAGPAFCAGADLTQLGDARDEGLRRIYEGFLRLARSPLPTIAAVNGPAVGAGMNLALACDVRVAGRSARFDTRFVDLGIHPGGGHTWMLRRAVGPQAAAAMVVFGERVEGPEAERIGLVWRCVADDELLDEAQRMAARAASGPPELVREVRSTLARMATVATHDEAVEIELAAQVASMDAPAFAERLAAMRRQVSRSTP
jgi:enoyl-CoA hydratase